MPVLVLLTGPPASGKSTLARAWVATRPLALDLDIDQLRALLGGWRDEPLPAGLAARRIALAAAETHLVGGYDVIVPQYLSLPDFADELRDTAARAGSGYAEVVLPVPLELAERRFAERAAAAGDDVHGPLVGESMSQVQARHAAFARGRAGAIVLDPAVSGCPTPAELDAVLAQAGSAKRVDTPRA